MRKLYIVTLLLVGILWFNMAAYAFQPCPYTPSIEIDFNIAKKVTAESGTKKVLVRTLIPKSVKNRQVISNLKFSPAPTRVFDAANGNRYAEFFIINPAATSEIKITGTAKIYNNDLSTTLLTQNGDHTSPVELSQYLQPEPFVESNHPYIKSIANTINNGSNELETITNVYQYVVNKLNYDGYHPQDMGALKALTLGNGDCSEFTTSFVALCRAKGIPARGVYGFTVDYNITPKHSWAEVYTKDHGWIKFDPTFKTNYDKLKPNYMYLSFSKGTSDKFLNNGYYSYLYYWGAPASIDSKFVAVKK